MKSQLCAKVAYVPAAVTSSVSTHTFNHCILASTFFRSPKTAFTEITKQSLTETAEEAFWT